MSFVILHSIEKQGCENERFAPRGCAWWVRLVQTVRRFVARLADHKQQQGAVGSGDNLRVRIERRKYHFREDKWT